MTLPTPALSNPYGVQLFTVLTPSGSELHLQTQEEANWYEDRRDRYQTDNLFPNVSDLQDLDRLLMLEVLSYRWGLWMAQGFDYLYARVDENQLKSNIKEYCVSEDTECLTLDGWVNVHGLEPGAQILAFDPVDGHTHWQVPTNVYTGRASSPMLSLEMRQHSSLSTADHRWWVDQRFQQHPVTGWRTSRELNTSTVIPLTAPHGDFPSESRYTDEMVELIAWYWTEGHYTSVCGRPTQGEIGQSRRVNQRNVEVIEQAFTKEFGPAAESGQRLDARQGRLWRIDDRDGMALFKFGVEILAAFEYLAPDRVPGPQFFMHLTKRQLERHIDISIRADGWELKPGGSVALAQRDKRRADYFQTLCLLSGREVYLRQENQSKMWRVAVSPSTRGARPLAAARGGKGATAEWIDYDGIIWCPSVPAGAWVSRRKGRISITGNSTEVRLVKNSLGIDKTTRDKDKGSSLADYTETLLERAKQFGYHRNQQYELAVTLFYELRSMVMTFDRCDEEERAILDLSLQTIFEWVRDKVIVRWDELSDAFRAEQRIWIKQM